MAPHACKNAVSLQEPQVNVLSNAFFLFFFLRFSFLMRCMHFFPLGGRGSRHGSQFKCPCCHAQANAACIGVNRALPGKSISCPCGILRKAMICDCLLYTHLLSLILISKFQVDFQSVTDTNSGLERPWRCTPYNSLSHSFFSQ